VIVVGNVTVGGTGKTPFVIWLAEELAKLGFRPGIVSRGHGGAANREPVRVTAASASTDAGDEAPLLARRTACPVYICRDRVAAVETLLAETACDIVIADDGLQHYRLARDVEIALVDGARGLGNGLLLPAGPLRESADRLEEVDWVVGSGCASGQPAETSVMTLLPRRFVSVGQPERAFPCSDLGARNVNAVAGIGNPARFLATLRELGLNPLLHAYPDHHRFDGSELEIDNGWPIVCTEKDAIKLRELGGLPDDVYYLEVGARVMNLDGSPGPARLQALLSVHGIRAARPAGARGAGSA
jgi:tetraacyldisaccharide 4'-kinase